MGNAFAPSNRSPVRPGQTTKKSPLPKQTVIAKPTIVTDERDDYDDDEFDELEEIINGDTGVESNTEPEVECDVEAELVEEGPNQMSEIDQTVKELLEEEEQLLNLHMTSIQENAELLTEEGGLLQSVQGEDDYDIDQYASRLGEILDRKTELIHSLQQRLGSFKELLKKEEELSRMR